MKYNLLFISVVSLLIFNNCKNKETPFNNLVGTWTASDGAKITLREDSTCVINNLNGAYFGYEENLNFKGTWNIEKGNIPIICKIFITSESNQTSITIYVSGKGLFGNNLPWHLFQYIGDPDELNKYRFTK